MLGNVILGYVGDRFGRKILLQWSAVLLSFFTALCAISVQTVMYMIIRFFCGVFSQGLILGYSIWMFELIGPKVRSAYFSYSHICFAIGCLLLAVMAACITDWRVLMVVISLSTAIPVLVIRKVPESPSWLMVKGRMHEAKESVVNIADANGVVLQPFELKKPLGHAESESKNVLSLFSSTSMAVNTFILLFCWFVICFSFYGVTFSLGDRLGGNRYVNFILSSLLEVPVHLTVISIADKWVQVMQYSLKLHVF
jgi:putative MFS transporter